MSTLRLSAEKEILGFFITGHPLEKYRDKLEGLNALGVSENLRHEELDRQRRNHHHRGHDW